MSPSAKNHPVTGNNTARVPSRVPVMAIAALVLLRPALLTLPAGAAVVSFGFSGVVTRVDNFPGELAGITEGTAFAGTLMYDPSVEGVVDTDKRPDIGGYYFHFEGGFQLTAQIGGHTVRSYAYNPGSTYAGISIYDGYDNNDWMSAGSSSSALLLDGAPYPEGASGSLSINFSDLTKTAFGSDGLPTTIPELSRFENTAAMNFRYAPKGGLNHWLQGKITSITPEPQYLLYARRKGNDLVLSWPATAIGFVLESRDTAAQQVWQPVAIPVVDTAAEHTVTVPMTAAGSRLFRLRR